MIGRVKSFFKTYPDLKTVLEKLMRDNVAILASVVAWTFFTSMVPIHSRPGGHQRHFLA
jgi:hypothetical protein